MDRVSGQNSTGLYCTVQEAVIKTIPKKKKCKQAKWLSEEVLQIAALPTKVHLVKAMVFPVVIYGCESCTIKKPERQRIDAF